MSAPRFRGFFRTRPGLGRRTQLEIEEVADVAVRGGRAAKVHLAKPPQKRASKRRRGALLSAIEKKCRRSHRVPRIDREVQEGALDPSWVREGAPKSARKNRLHAHGLTDGSLKKVRHARDERVGVQNLRRQWLLAGKGQPPRRKLGGALGGLVSAFKVGHETSESVFDVWPCDAADYHGEHIVEVVSDATRELTDRFHLLQLPELALGSITLGDLPLQGLRPIRYALFQFLVEQAQIAFGAGRASKGGVMA